MEEELVRRANIQTGADAMVLDEQDSGALDTRLDDLQRELLRLANMGSQYVTMTDEICRLREMK